MRRTSLLVLAACAALVGACSTSASSDEAGAPVEETTSTTVAFPGAEWAVADPVAVGLDPGALDQLETYLAGTGSNCMAVVKDGRLVREQYWNGTTADTDQEIFSATKSITSVLVGMAEADGVLELDQPAADLVVEWQGTPSATVTIRDLLANVSGRFWSFSSDYGDLLRSPDKTGYAIGLGQQFAPGETWEYNNAAIQTLDAVIERSTGTSTAELARTRLFEPLGMTSTIRQDPSGNTLTFMGAQASCRDLARFGHLLLNEGRWGDEQIVPADFVRRATSPSSPLNAAYGYLIWLNRPGDIRLPTVGALQGPLWPAAPEDAFAALGLGGQTVLVIPSEGLVVTRLANARGEVSSQGNVVNEAAELLVG